MNFIEMNNVTKIYGEKDSLVHALKSVSICIEQGEMIAIMGPSGSGKSTLLNIMGGLDLASSGEYMLDNKEVFKLDNKSLAKIRNRNIGFVFQQFGLFSEYTAIENLEIPLIYRNLTSTRNERLSRKVIRHKAEEMLKALNIENQARKYPKQMSGGQQQRVAIGRALMAECPLILADEPTGALDQKTGEAIIEMLKDINAKGKTVIIVTHDENVASHCRRKIVLKDGEIMEDFVTKVSVV